MKINIGHICPELLNMYGDKGNITVLKKRIESRGIECEVMEFKLNDEITTEGIDILYLGGGGDKEIVAVLNKLNEVKQAFKDYVEADGVLLAVCSGYELISKKFYLKGQMHDGLGLINTESSWADKRFVSNVVVRSSFGLLAGFENHNGRMDIKDNTPLGKVIFGNGNNGEDGYEGVVYKNTFATYLDGPLLPKNPELCDEIIKRALVKKYKEDIILQKLDDTVEIEAKNYIVNKYTKNA